MDGEASPTKVGQQQGKAEMNFTDGAIPGELPPQLLPCGSTR